MPLQMLLFTPSPTEALVKEVCKEANGQDLFQVPRQLLEHFFLLIRLYFLHCGWQFEQISSTHGQKRLIYYLLNTIDIFILIRVGEIGRLLLSRSE